MQIRVSWAFLLGLWAQFGVDVRPEHSTGWAWTSLNTRSLCFEVAHLMVQFLLVIAGTWKEEQDSEE